MLRIRSIAIPALVLVALTACSDGDDGPDTVSTTSTRAAGGGETKLTVTGVATKTGGDPAAPTEVPFSGEVDCGENVAGTPGEDQLALVSGKGIFVTTAPQVCRQLADVPDVFDLVGADPDRICTEIYGGPQTAHIEGTVDGEPVDVDIARNDGCGIDDWTTLEFLLGAPEQ